MDSETENHGPKIDPEAAHLDSFTAAEVDADAMPEDDVQRVGEAAPETPEQISREAFGVVWRQAFNLPGLIAPSWKPLAVQPAEEEACQAASDAAYEILEIYWPAALHPAGDMAARLAALVPFVLAKVLVVREILAAAKSERIEAAQAANTNGPPPEFRSKRAAPGADLAEMVEPEDRAA